ITQYTSNEAAVKVCAQMLSEGFPKKGGGGSQEPPPPFFGQFLSGTGQQERAHEYMLEPLAA
ncbi:MAG: hypothetical protein ACE5GO_10195, partial [Anaerolineales bacterium]